MGHTHGRDKSAAAVRCPRCQARIEVREPSQPEPRGAPLVVSACACCGADCAVRFSAGGTLVVQVTPRQAAVLAADARR